MHYYQIIYTIILVLLCVFTTYLFTDRKNAKKSLKDLTGKLAETETELVSAMQTRRKVEAAYFAEVEDVGGWFSTKFEVRFKFHIIIDGLPFGTPTLIATHLYKRMNESRINKLLEDYAKPLFDAGIKILNEGIKRLKE